MGLLANLVGAIIWRTITRKELHWSEVQQWLAMCSSPADVGRGYTVEPGRSAKMQPFGIVQLHINHGYHTVTAEVFMSRSCARVAHKSWTTDSLDSELKKLFGHNRRFRVEL